MKRKSLIKLLAILTFLVLFSASSVLAQSENYPVVRMAYSRMFATDSESKIEEALNKIMREEAKAEIDLVPVAK